MNTSPVYYSDTVTENEFFFPGPHCGFYCSPSAAELIAEVECGDITGPGGEPIREIHLALCDGLSRRVWSA